MAQPSAEKHHLRIAWQQTLFSKLQPIHLHHLRLSVNKDVESLPSVYNVHIAEHDIEFALASRIRISQPILLYWVFCILYGSPYQCFILLLVKHWQMCSTQENLDIVILLDFESQGTY